MHNPEAKIPFATTRPAEKVQIFEEKKPFECLFSSDNYYLCPMINALRQFENVPVTAVTIGSAYPNLREKNKKVRWLEKRGEIVRLKRGLYVVSPEITGVPLSTELMANHIYSPSYVSMASALRYYGLIPERVYETQSMTTKHAQNFDTPYGRFTYTTVSLLAFHIGVRSINKGSYAFLMASPEKALCDLVANTPRVNLRYVKEARLFLEEDIRLDMDAFRRMDDSILANYAEVGKKSDSVRTILKLLKHEKRYL